MSKQFVATRSVLLDGRMYQKDELIECPLTRGRAKLLMATKTIEEYVNPDVIIAKKVVTQIQERNSIRPAKAKRVKG